MKVSVLWGATLLFGGLSALGRPLSIRQVNQPLTSPATAFLSSELGAPMTYPGSTGSTNSITPDTSLGSAAPLNVAFSNLDGSGESAQDPKAHPIDYTNSFVPGISSGSQQATSSQPVLSGDEEISPAFEDPHNSVGGGLPTVQPSTKIASTLPKPPSFDDDIACITQSNLDAKALEWLIWEISDPGWPVLWGSWTFRPPTFQTFKSGPRLEEDKNLGAWKAFVKANKGAYPSIGLYRKDKASVVARINTGHACQERRIFDDGTQDQYLWNPKVDDDDGCDTTAMQDLEGFYKKTLKPVLDTLHFSIILQRNLGGIGADWDDDLPESSPFE